MTQFFQNQVSPLGVTAQDLQICHDIIGLESWHLLAGKRILSQVELVLLVSGY
jgi:hypothetical protein